MQLHELSPQMRYYYRHHEARKSNTRRLNRERSDFLSAYKLERGCIDCGYRAHAEALDFDHVTGEKLVQVSWIKRASMKRLMAEIAKCEVVCANCHRVRSRLQHITRTGID